MGRAFWQGGALQSPQSSAYQQGPLPDLIPDSPQQELCPKHSLASPRTKEAASASQDGCGVDCEYSRGLLALERQTRTCHFKSISEKCRGSGSGVRRERLVLRD